MGGDSFTLEQSLWIRNAIADTMLEQCACELYNGGYSCLRCDLIERAKRLFPIQHAQAEAGYRRYIEAEYGVQP